MEINWWHPKWKENYHNQNYSYEICPNRNYINFSLSNERLEKEKQLLSFRQELKKLISNNDTIDGLHIILNNNSTYGDIIAVLNILKLEKANMYVLKDNDVWVFNYFPKEIRDTTEIFQMSCGGTRDMLCQVLPIAQESNFLNGILSPEFNDELNPLLKVWPVFILFFVLVVITFKNFKLNRKS
ncbi:MAG: hypothetical protein ACOVOQ_12110 [Flavobacterium sp.]